MKITEPQLTDTALKIAQKRYLKTDLEGHILETPGEMFWRVAKHLAKAEINWGENGIVDQTAKTFFERMVNFKFVVAGKAMFEAGNPGGTGQLSSCFVLPVEDNIHSIFKTLGDAAVVHKNNGGTGFNFSKIRPRGDRVKNVPNSSSGPVDFLLAYSAALSKILQGSKRQGANIGILNCDHPDIIDFITLKDEDGTIKNFNISVGVTNAFMEAVEADKMWELINPRNGEVVKRLKARKLFDLIVEHAWATGDPGLAFLDRMQEDNPTPTLGVINCTNPCGEIPLLPYESCNLTSIVLSNHLKRSKKQEVRSKEREETKTSNLKPEVCEYEIDWEDLEKSIKIGVQLLDDMIEVNTYALPEIEQMVKNGNRRIGLGVMGFAHLLYRLGIPYDSQEAIRLSERLSKFIRQKAEEMSLQLGKQRGVFPNWDRSIYAGSAERYRNCALTMIAPTGTISMLSNCSSGIEPVFSLVTLRKTFFEDDKTNRPTEELMLIDPVLQEYLELRIINQESRNKILQKIAETNSLDEIEEFTKKEKKIFTTTHHIDWQSHVKIQAAWQKHFDNSVSKTINFSNSATVEEVKQAYILAWRLGCKGITIYRDGSKQDQVLNVATSESRIKNQEVSSEEERSIKYQIPNIKVTDQKFETGDTKRSPVSKHSLWNPGDLPAGRHGTPSTSVAEGFVIEDDGEALKPKILDLDSDSDVCPECGATISKSGGTATCHDCGWSQSTL